MKEKEEVFNWIKKIIENCNNTFHFEAVEKLIELFDNKYEDDYLVTELKLIKVQTWNKIHNVL